MLKAEIYSYSLYEFLMLVKHFHVILFLDEPNKDALIHTWRNYITRILGPTQV